MKSTCLFVGHFAAFRANINRLVVSWPCWRSFSKYKLTLNLYYKLSTMLPMASSVPSYPLPAAGDTWMLDGSYSTTHKFFHHC